MKMLTIALAILIPSLASGYNAFIWNYDTLDRFYEPDLGDSVTCAYWIEQTLSNNGHTYVTGTTLPTNLDAYDIVFVTLGFYRC